MRRLARRFADGAGIAAGVIGVSYLAYRAVWSFEAWEYGRRVARRDAAYEARKRAREQEETRMRTHAMSTPWEANRPTPWNTGGTVP